MTEPYKLIACWRVVELEEAFRIDDAEGKAVAYVQMTNKPDRQSLTRYMTPDQARVVAYSIAALPEMRTRLAEVEAELSRIIAYRDAG